MPASPSRRHPPGSQAEVRGRWVSSTCPLDLPSTFDSGSQAEVRGRWVSSTREVRRKFVAGGCPRLAHPLRMAHSPSRSVRVQNSSRIPDSAGQSFDPDVDASDPRTA
jgi:hypothetical protein